MRFADVNLKAALGLLCKLLVRDRVDKNAAVAFRSHIIPVADAAVIQIDANLILRQSGNLLHRVFDGFQLRLGTGDADDRLYTRGRAVGGRVKAAGRTDRSGHVAGAGFLGNIIPIKIFGVHTGTAGVLGTQVGSEQAAVQTYLRGNNAIRLGKFADIRQIGMNLFHNVAPYGCVVTVLQRL